MSLQGGLRVCCGVLMSFVVVACEVCIDVWGNG